MKKQPLSAVFCCLALLVCAFPVHAQLGNVTLIPFPGAPTGGCNSMQLALNLSTGTLYNCYAGTWTALASATSGACATNPATGGCAIPGNPDIDLFPGSGGVGPGTNWALQLLTSGLNVTVPLTVNTGAGTAGVYTFLCGTAPSVGSGISMVGPASCTPYNLIPPAAPGSGYWLCTNLSTTVTCNFEANINLAADVGSTVLPVANGGTGNAAASGALINLFPNPTRAGDVEGVWNGAAWIPLAGCQTSTCFFTELGNGTPGWTQSPIAVNLGGTGVSSQTLNTLYKGNGTSAMSASSITDNGTTVATGELVTANGGVTLPSGQTLTIQSGATLTCAAGSTCPAGTGTVTSVTFTGDGIVDSATPSTAVTGSGTVLATVIQQAKNTVLAGPASGSNANPTFRALVGGDLPNPAASTLGGIESIVAASHNWVAYIDTSGVPHQSQPAFSDISGTATTAQIPAALLATGTSVSLTAPTEIYVCTSTCTVTPPVPAAGYQFCVFNGDNVSTVITMAALGSSARYENTARTAYGTAGTGTFTSGGAVGDSVCLLGLDSTHYLTVNYTGTWTAS